MFIMYKLINISGSQLVAKDRKVYSFGFMYNPSAKRADGGTGGAEGYK